MLKSDLITVHVEVADWITAENIINGKKYILTTQMFHDGRCGTRSALFTRGSPQHMETEN